MAQRSNQIEGTVRHTIARHSMVPDDGPILVAVSGGPDSVALTHIMRALEHPFHIAHVDHQTRGNDSAADAEFVREIAERLNVPFHETTVDVQQAAGESPLSFEEVAREIRYAFFFETSRREGCAAIATGHHADDQAETVLMRLLRGSSPRGLAGIPPVANRTGLRIIRPLLDVTRDQIIDYLAENGIEYRTDVSNQDFAYLRNRLRHDLLPKLESDYNPNLRQALRRTAETLRAENEVIAKLTDALLEELLEDQRSIRREVFRTAPLAIQRRAIVELSWRNGVDCDFNHVNGAAQFISTGATGKVFVLGGGVELSNGREITVITARPDRREDEGAVRLALPGSTVAFGKRFTLSHLVDRPAVALADYCNATRQVFDVVAMDGALQIRHRRPGDRFQPFGMSGTRKLNDYLSDLGIPRVLRGEQLLLTCDDEIVWVVGHAIAARAAIVEFTSRIVQIEVEDAAE